MSNSTTEKHKSGWFPGKYIKYGQSTNQNISHRSLEQARDDTMQSKTITPNTGSFSSTTSLPLPPRASTTISLSQAPAQPTPSAAASLLSSLLPSPLAKKTAIDDSPKVFKEAFHHQFRPEWRGVIKKQGHRIKNWKSRYFVISNCVMLYYRSEAEYMSPEKCQDPLGFHLITSISPMNSKGYAPAGTLAGATISSNAAATAKLMTADQDFVLETLEEKTFYLKFSFSSGFLSAAQRAVAVHQAEYQSGALPPPLRLVVCLSHIGCLDLSIQLLQTLAINSNSRAECLYHLGTALLVNNNFSDAISVLQDCLDIKADHVPALVNLATAFYCTDNMDHARSLFETALSLEPSNIEAANNLTLLYAQNGTKSEFELAEFKIKYAIACRSSEPRLYLTYAEILLSVNDLDRAIDVLFQGLKDVPAQESSDLNLKIGELLFLKSPDKSEAIEYFHTAIGINPRNFKARQLLQEALLARENTISAKEQAVTHSNNRQRKPGRRSHTGDVAAAAIGAGPGASQLALRPEGGGGDEEAGGGAAVLQGMLALRRGGVGGEWQDLFCELSRLQLQWFPSGALFTKQQQQRQHDPLNDELEDGDEEDEVSVSSSALPARILIADIASICKASESEFQFDIEVAHGGCCSFRATSEHDANTWLDALHLQRVCYDRNCAR